MRVIVCGGRDYDDRPTMKAVLGALDLDCTIITGNARGADRLALNLWEGPGEYFDADWHTHGLAAGPIRNQAMLDEGADLVIAFPGGRGTADMVKRARKAGVPVLEVTP
jgi:hypothetical protein